MGCLELPAGREEARKEERRWIDIVRKGGVGGEGRNTGSGGGWGTGVLKSARAKDVVGWISGIE